VDKLLHGTVELQHGVPPPEELVVIVYVCVCRPKPHVTEHPDQALHTPAQLTTVKSAFNFLNPFIKLENPENSKDI
jgi:hypothetical protein